MVGTDRIEFPALCIASNGFVYGVADQATLDSCSTTAFKAGYFDGLRVFDAEGKAGVVRGTTYAGAMSSPVGWRLWRIFRTSFIRVGLDLEWLPELVGLHQLQQVVCASMDQLPDPWEDSEGGVASAKRAVREAQSIPALVQLFLGEVFTAKESWRWR
ncbi:MAG TPA: hypothetical protein VII13_00325 [Vicinamibacteria bacterium]|jgi:hypothetical protein